MGEVVSRGNRIVYDVQGAGPTVVMVAGLSQWRAQLHEAGYVDALSGRYTVVCVDLLGHGESDKPQDPAAYRLDDLAADIVAVADDVGDQRFGLWGYSAGATIACAVAGLVPDRVAALVCGSGGWQAEPEVEEAWRGELVELLRTPGGLVAFWEGVGFTDPLRVADALGRNDPLALAAGLAGSARTRPAYGRLCMPILGYRGDQEDYPELDALFVRLGAEVHLVPDAGHLDAFDRSADVLAFVEPFLARQLREGAAG